MNFVRISMVGDVISVYAREDQVCDYMLSVVMQFPNYNWSLYCRDTLAVL
jgi:hypothetical protein